MVTTKIKDFEKDISNDETGYMHNTGNHLSIMGKWMLKFFKKFGIGTKISKKHWGNRKSKELQDIVYKAVEPVANGKLTPTKSNLKMYDDLRKNVKSKKHNSSDFARVARTETASVKVIYQLMSWQEAGVTKVKHHNNKGSVARGTVGSRDKLYNNRVFTIKHLLSKAGDKDRIPLHPNCMCYYTIEI